MQKARDRLEVRVGERTQELWAANEHLQNEVAERKRAEEIIRAERDKLETVTQNIGAGLTIISKDYKIAWANNVTTQRFGDVEGKTCYATFHGRSEVCPGCSVRDIFEKGRENATREQMVKDSQGNTVWLENIATPVKDKEGNVIAALELVLFITERKRAGDALRESEQRFHTIFDSVNDAIIVQDLTTGVMLDVNQRMCELYGVAREEALGSDIGVTASGIPPYTRQDAVEWMRKAVEEGPQRFEWHTKDKAGRLFWIEVYLRLVTIGGEDCLLGTAQDITERKRTEEEKALLQEQLRQSQKMEAIGRLAGGIAHDFNNLLTIIKGYSQLPLADLKEEDPLRENFNEIQNAAERAARLTRQILAFSRRQILVTKVLDLNVILHDLDKMLQRVIGEDIELVTLPAEDLGKVKSDSGQIEQVIMNLAVNARDAMPNGGKMTIETANVELDESYARRHIAVKPGRYVMLGVSDTGVGMTPEVRNRVFEPFFTTKERGKGTGLGLSTVYGIVKQSGGNIWVYSEPGQGTTFKIYLPVVDEAVVEEPEKRPMAETARGGETTLVVEDDENVRKLTSLILNKQGYRVLEASNGEEALAICKALKEPLHLVLTDVVMPGMSGNRVIEELRRAQGSFKVLFMSGYTDNAIVHHGVLEVGTNFIQKPFTVDGLIRKVREALDK